jgi:hypothetical protein
MFHNVTILLCMSAISLPTAPAAAALQAWEKFSAKNNFFKRPLIGVMSWLSVQPGTLFAAQHRPLREMKKGRKEAP